MPLLQVRDFPEDVYERLARVAHDENRPIDQEAIILLRQALDQKEEKTSKRKHILESITALDIKGSDSFPDPVYLIREDRLR